MITFVVPVRHPANARSWDQTKKTLSATVESIAAQRCGDWNAVVVANRGSDLPWLPPRFETVWVDLPPNPLHDQKDMDAFRLDKGRRVLSGMDSREADYFMTVDDDDLVSDRLAGFVFGKNIDGWCIKEGYVWDGQTVGPVSDFHSICGSSHIVHVGALQEMLHRTRDAKLFGSHVLLHDHLQLETLPFPGAIYRTCHSNAHSQLQLHPKGPVYPDVLSEGMMKEIEREFGRLTLER